MVATTMTFGVPMRTPVVHAQTAPVGAGFPLDAGDLRFIYHAIEIAQQHAVTRTAQNPCGTLIGNGPNQIADPQLPLGLRLVDGSCNSLVTSPDQHLFGASDMPFPRLTTKVFRGAQPFDADGPGPQPAQATSYNQTSGFVSDPQPRTASNLVVEQKRVVNPAAAAIAGPDTADDDPVTGTVFIPNVTPDFGLSAPFNLMFAFFGQFFDHGLDLVNKGGNGTVIMPLAADDPLFSTASNAMNFIPLTRATVDPAHEAVNQTTPWVDQNQTYTSHPAHQVFLRQYEMVNGKPVPDGRVLDGGYCSTRTNGVPGEQICDIGTWGEVKAQAAAKLGIKLSDQDVFDVPMVVTDPYGHFVAGPNGFPQIVLANGGFEEGDPTANGGTGIEIPADAMRTGHQFLNDIAHNAAPDTFDNDNNPATPPVNKTPDLDTEISVFGVTVQPAGTYDDELLARHFVTGDGRGNENIALTAVHTIFHAEHNRLRNQIDRLVRGPNGNCVGSILSNAECVAWQTPHAGSGWTYGERLFQASRFVTEMEYQHLVFEEFARKMQPLINPFLGGITTINPAIPAEFAHTVYRLGHSMLPEIIARTVAAPNDGDVRLKEAFLNPVEFNEARVGNTTVTLPAAKALGSIVRGLNRQVGNELDEFVTDSVRNTLVGLPLDLAAINLARGRSEGIAPLNEVRRQLFLATHNSALTPYPNWFEFGLNLRNYGSLPNFIAAYGTHPSITGATTTVAKRAAAQALVDSGDAFMFSSAAGSGLNDVDLWLGGLAEKPAVFGGLLGSTFNYVFEKTLEDLQNGDRMYYLQRTDGLNMRFALESNSLAELIRRNSDFGASLDNVFETADFNLEMALLTGNAPVQLGNGIVILTLADGTKLFFDPSHGGRNVVFNGTEGNDRMQADVGDDSLFGNGGNDRIDGGEGNDTISGGDGDDVLFGGNGDDVIKAGAGNDALESGPGFGGDILMAGDGNDYLKGGNDGVEHFGGAGNDVFVDGDERAEGIFGGTGDDWIFAGHGHDGGMFGDNGNVFDLTAGVDPVGGDDVLDGGPGQDNAFGEGGDDIMLPSEGSNKFMGDFGFDWFTMRSYPVRAELTGVTGFSVDLSLLANPAVPLNFNDLRNKYRFVDGASGWRFNDEIRGDNKVLCVPPGEVAECLVVGMELTAEGAAKINGLTQLMGPTGFNQSLTDPAIPGVKGVGFMGGNILLGGEGSDLLEGGGGDDLIDGDAWLNVQLVATMNDGTVRKVDNAQDLETDVFSDPQRLNPGSVVIEKTIVRPTAPQADCGAGAAAVNCDVASFRDPLSSYDIIRNSSGSVTVVHARPLVVAINDGTDTVRNIEKLRFPDGDFSLVANNPATGTVTLAPLPATEGVLLNATANITDADGLGGVVFLFQWQMETTPNTWVPIASGTSFTPAGAQAGHRLRVAVIFVDHSGNAETVLSAPTAAVINVNSAPTAGPALTGGAAGAAAPQEGETLTANAGTIVDPDGLAGVAFTFQWQQGTGAAFTNIAGATAASFLLTEAQVNSTVRVRARYTDNGGTLETVFSDASGIVGDVFTGTPNNDTYTGTAGRDDVSGLGGNDTLDTNAGDDVVRGGSGNDTITTNNGNDTVTGGADTDTISTGADNDIIRVGLDDGTDSVNGGAGIDEIRALAPNTVIGLSALSGVETITANGNAGVIIAGSDAADTLDFSAVTLTGIVTIDGGAGADTITGSAAADVILGSGGADSISGGPGSDTITGGNGDDILNGQGGQNVFSFSGTFDNDTINGFDANPTGGQDLLDITGFAGITGTNFTNRVSITASGANTLIQVKNAQAAVMGSITLVNVAPGAVTATDFRVNP